MRLFPQKLCLLILVALFTLAAGLAIAGNEKGSTEAAAQGFLTYLLAPGTDIGADAPAQDKWLTADLKKLMADATAEVEKARTYPWVDGPDPAIPGNAIFLHAWDYPTLCKTGRATEAAESAQVPVNCSWGPKTNYPGSKRSGLVLLKKEDGVWRIADIEWDKSKDSSKENVIQGLKQLMEDAKRAAGDKPDGY